MTKFFRSRIFLIAIAAAVGLFLLYEVKTDFALLRFWAGYNVPSLATPDVSPPPSGQTPSNSPSNELAFLELSSGFTISRYATGLDGPRVIAFDPKGRVVISETKAGRVTILEDTNSDGTADKKRTLRDGLNQPHGLAFYTDPKTNVAYLYIAETHRVARYPYDLNSGTLIGDGEVIATLPGGGRHFTRTILFGPNFRTKPIVSGFKELTTLGGEKLYISVGSSCDVCVEDTWKRAAILESDPKGTFTAEFAGGLRNAVFFAFHPVTNELWATEMGRDNLGDNLPPDEVNIVKVAGSEHKFGARRYGWPFCYGRQITDTTFSPDKVERIDIPRECSQTEPSAVDLPAHSAPLGLVFIAGQSWPKEWQNDLLVAYHGSWNRSVPTGYKIVRIDLDESGRVRGVSDFITGWLARDKKTILGRPVDLKFSSAGDLYVSDDAAGVIYRVRPQR